MLDTPDELEFEKVDLLLGDHKNSLTVREIDVREIRFI
jgi:hypothetical protein